MQLGPYTLKNNLFLAPMAGVTDWPFRQLCSQMGAGLVVSEMMSSKPELWQTKKSLQRASHNDESYPRSVQIAGADPAMMAAAAQYNVGLGAQIIDINMGCPAKKVCKKACGSALLKDEELVARILEAVVEAVDVPVTLKIRTGWSVENRNGVAIAKLAEQAGIAALAVHGRTREEKYKGIAEYDTIKTIKENVQIPVIANGDINCTKKAKYVLEYTGADAIMLGRAAQGKPWIFQEIEHFLATGEHLLPPSQKIVCNIILQHLENLYSLYDEFLGVRIARKHVGWYLNAHPDVTQFRREFNGLDSAKAQLSAIRKLFGY